MKADIFIKTYAGDVEWLRHCLKHLRFYTKGFRRLVVVAPPEIEQPVRRAGLRRNDLLHLIPEGDDGYFFQQQIKLHALNLTDADYICFVDSDCLAKRQFTPEDFFVNGKPHFLYTSYSRLQGSGAERWKPGTEQVIGQPVEHEFMRRHPAFYPREVLRQFDDWMMRTHGHCGSQFMRLRGRDLVLSEFNLMGAWCWHYRKDAFTWLNTETESFPPDFLEQFWSYGGPDHPHNAERFRAVTIR